MGKVLGCSGCVFFSKGTDDLCMCLALAQPMRGETDLLCEGELFREADTKASREDDLIAGFQELKNS